MRRISGKLIKTRLPRRRVLSHKRVCSSPHEQMYVERGGRRGNCEICDGKKMRERRARALAIAWEYP